ncbi:glycoside hydrolase family protein [Pseudomonas putida S11]|nr:glycoside hydrolase family protein [Pseudomonas putida S11]
MDRPMPSSTRLLLPLYLLACLLALLGLGGLWYGLGKPVQLPDAASPTHKLQCASYTPFDKDQSPYDQPVAPAPGPHGCRPGVAGRAFPVHPHLFPDRS